MLRRAFLLLIVVFAFGLAAGPSLAQDTSNTLVVTSLSDISTLDPHIGYDTLSWPTIGLVYRGLITMSEVGNYQPALAESFEVSEDGLVYTFVLREGITFSNGRAITPEDVKYSFTRLLDPATASPTAYMFNMIEGAEEFIAGEADEVSGIAVLDERTVQFTLTRPEWTLLNRFALPPGMIIAREGVEAAENFGRAPLGAGPFVLDSWESGIRLTFSRNPNYYEPGLPVLDGVIIDVGIDPSVGILRIENGEADMSLDFVPNSDYARIATDPNLADNLIEITAFPNTQYMIPNVRSAPFDSLEVRTAINMAIDRDRIVTILNNRAVPAAGPIPPGVEGDNPDLPVATYDPEAARQMLADAGYPEGFTTQLYSTTDPVDVAVMQSVVEDLAQIGVTVELIPVEFAQWLDIAYNRPEEMPLAYIGWFMDYQDPSNVYEPLIACGGSFNPGGYCNEEMDAVFFADKALPPGDERWAAYAELEAMIAENLPNFYIAHLRNFYYVSDRVATLDLDAALLANFATASLGE